MLLIQAKPIDTPLDAEMVMEQLWQLTMGRRIGLFLIGMHDPEATEDEAVRLGVSCHRPGFEELVADVIARRIHGDIEVSPVGEMIMSSTEVASVSIRHVNRMVPQDGGPTWGWQRPDFLRGAFEQLKRMPPGVVAGAGMTLRSLPNAAFEMSMTSFAAGPGAAVLAWQVATTYAGVGVALRHPFPSERRVVRLMLDVRFRWPRTRQSVAVVSAFWHPPFKLRAPAIAPWAS